MNMDGDHNINGEEKSRLGSTNRTAVINSHKKMMHRSASAPSVQQNESFDDAQKKRNRTTPDQLQILEEVFARNPTPNSQLRDAIAHKVGMSPRSVQVWFQNRRAKEKKSSHNRPDMDPSKGQIPLFLNPYQMMPGNPHMMHPSFVPGPRMGMPPTSILGAEAAAFGFSTIQHPMNPIRPQMPMGVSYASMPNICLPLDRLKIGTWTRLAMSDQDLVCGIDINTTNLSWIVVESVYRCKIEFPFSSILSIEAHIVDEGFTFVNIQIDTIPKFYLEVRNNSQTSMWKACNDITEAKQASTHFKHSVQMSTSVFRDEMLGVIRNNIILHKALNLRDDTTSPNHAMVLNQREFEHKPQNRFAPQDDERSMKKSISVPTLPYTMGRFSEQAVNEIDYSAFVTEQPEEVNTTWSRQSEIGSYSHIDLDSLGLPSLGSSNSFSSIGSSTLAASLEESNLEGV